MILELKRDKERKSAAYKRLAQETLAERVEVRAFTQQANLKVQNLDEVTEAEELVTALRQQCELQVATAAVRIWKGAAGTQVALVPPVVHENKSVKARKINVA